MKLAAIPIQFPPGEILDRNGFVWVTLPPNTGIAQSRILGTCSCDPFDLRIVQVTINRGDWRLDLLAPEQPAAFPLVTGFAIAVPGMEQHDVRAWSTVEDPVRIIVHVRRSQGAPRDQRGRLIALPNTVKFHLVLLARGAEEPS